MFSIHQPASSTMPKTISAIPSRAVATIGM